jgi:Mg-chelatase subunit ChlD
MKRKETWILAMLILVIAAALFTLASITPADKTVGKTTTATTVTMATTSRRDVDLVICLDTSGSMSGLIESAKQKLWAIVNELATANPKPYLRVGLYHYGNSGLDRETGWVKRLCPLTENLDEVYEKLFELRTNGGEEYVARVVRAAVMDLEWSTQKNALKMIVVAGNEAATQDPKYKLHDICKDTISKGVVINTIFCGAVETGRNTGWSDAARWSDGQYAAIDQNNGTVAISTPYDKKMLKLNKKLNKTYVGYGSAGQAGKARQAANDANAAKCKPETAAGRVAAKASGLYKNTDWDLVDAAKSKKVDVAKIPAKELPKNMQEMTVGQRKEHIAVQGKKRIELQKEIKDLQARRVKYQKKEMAKKGLSESKSFDGNLRQAIREQGQKKGMTFEQK